MAGWCISRALVRMRHFVLPSGSADRILFIRLPAAAWNFSKVVPNICRTLLLAPVRDHVRHLRLKDGRGTDRRSPCERENAKQPKLRATLVQSLEFVGLKILQISAVILVEDESHHRGKHLCGTSSEKDISSDMTCPGHLLGSRYAVRCSQRGPRCPFLIACPR